MMMIYRDAQEHDGMSMGIGMAWQQSPYPARPRASDTSLAPPNLCWAFYTGRRLYGIPAARGMLPRMGPSPVVGIGLGVC